MHDHMMELLETLLRKAYKGDSNIRFVRGDRRLTAFIKGKDRYLTVTWKLDVLTDSLSRPTNWPKDW